MNTVVHLLVPLAATCVAMCAIAPNATRAQGPAPGVDGFPPFVAASPPVPGPNGTSLVAGGVGRYLPSHALAVVRTRPDGTPDVGFGSGGIAQLTVWGASESAQHVAVQRDGSLLVSGLATDPSAQCASGPSFCSSRYVVLFRLLATGAVDHAFGNRGQAVLAVRDDAGFDRTPLTHAVAFDWDGTILLHATSDPYGDPRPLVLRIDPSGRVERATNLPDHYTVAPPGPVAVQFRHVLLDHHFVTTDTAEIAGLNRDEERGWIWEGDGFRVFPAAVRLPGTVPVCRFYGLPEFGLDSHFLSANDEECRLLEESADDGWILESREVFRVKLPSASTGACVDGDAVRIFRLWNGRGDSSHYYTVRKAYRDWFAGGRGYVSEGWGKDGVAMCGAP